MEGDRGSREVCKAREVSMLAEGIGRRFGGKVEAERGRLERNLPGTVVVEI